MVDYALHYLFSTKIQKHAVFNNLHIYICVNFIGCKIFQDYIKYLYIVYYKGEECKVGHFCLCTA